MEKDYPSEFRVPDKELDTWTPNTIVEFGGRQYLYIYQAGYTVLVTLDLSRYLIEGHSGGMTLFRIQQR